MQLSVYACSDKGCVRSNNEDNLYVSGIIREPVDNPRLEVCKEFRQSRTLFAVCDGMGGEANGEYASLAAVKVLGISENVDVYQEALNNTQEAHMAVKTVQKELFSRHTGTTLAAFAVNDGRGIAYNLGDSRVYHFRKGKLKQLTQDHTIADYLVELGIIDKEQSKNHPNRNSLTQFLGMDFDGKIEPHFSDEIQLYPDDIVIICSDGLYGMVDDKKICSICCHGDSTTIGKILMSQALTAGGTDNISVIVILVQK